MDPSALDAVQSAVAVLRRDPARTAILTDFDGTLSRIVADPLAAGPLPGAVDVLSELSMGYGRVAVVSGRPVRYLVDQLGAVEGPLILSGLYGLEEAQRPPAGEWRVEERPEAANWRAVVAEAADRADRDLPAEVFVERKGLSVTLHWRRHPELAPSVNVWAGRETSETGLALHTAKASIELRPPVDRDKGSVVAELGATYDAACFVGDDVGDLPAFEALRRLAAKTVAVAVTSPEVDARVVAAAGVVVDGPEAALEFLRQLV